MSKNKLSLEEHEVKECLYVASLPDADNDMVRFKVGDKKWEPSKPHEEWPVVTRITLQRDVPSEYAITIRACVWIGDQMIWECPYSHLSEIGYSYE